ncbi:MAG: protein translocase SEC61 complex subunit gamma [Candidatus Diapherotrites archaeon]|nr:protein translocase SEC61 complex subunit gamma [Candidatus Diapherotrites archaeon]
MGIRDFIESSRRVFTISKKPDLEEYLQMLKITALGVIVLGLIGFVVAILFAYFGPTAIR